ncbi:Gfo/Idh/MocA family oxidoreductase [Streptomyces sp. NPDC007251]|uniref:Gfo/Idh/MocA family protein n=1 Tax=Streptomyces sp. NPDC007251 TaxID=3154483 RepID=UPI0033F1410C
MLQPLVVGLGRSGSGLHLRTLTRLARRSGGSGGTGDLPVALPAVGCDPRAAALRPACVPGEVTVVATLEEAVAHVEPATAVAHVCTPPGVRHAVVAALAGHGVRRMIVEKPLAASRAELDALVRLRDEAGLDLVPVSHWTASRLTARLRRLIHDGRLGRLRRITVDQHKPRFSRSLATDSHSTALDVEIPHSLALALDLAGPAELRAAHCWDLLCEDRRLPGLGGAHLELEHHSGVFTLLRSDLGAPVRQRSVRCEFDTGTVTAHFPLSEDDDHAQLVVTAYGGGAPVPSGGAPASSGAPGTCAVGVTGRTGALDAGGVPAWPGASGGDGMPAWPEASAGDGAPAASGASVADGMPAWPGRPVTAAGPARAVDPATGTVPASSGAPVTGGTPASAKVPLADGVPGPGRQVFRDDALTAFLAGVYRRFASGTVDAGGFTGTAGFELACAAARLLCEARDQCTAAPSACAGSR